MDIRNERLGEHPLEDIDAVHQAIMCHNPRAARAVLPDRVNLVAIGHGAAAFGEVSDAADRCDVAVY